MVRGIFRSPVAVALAAVGVSALLRLAFNPLLGAESPMLIFVLGVAVAGTYAGVGAGVLATLVSIPLGAFLFLDTRLGIVPVRAVDYVRLSIFAVEGLLIATVTGRARRQADNLEEEVQRRTSELRASNEALETFAHTMSHDLRSPLRSMRGFAEILEADFGPSLAEEARDYTGRISRAAHRLEELVDNLLAYTRLGRHGLAPEPVSLDRAFETALADLDSDIRAAGATVSVERPLGVVLGHAETIELMVTNLLTNALKYVARGRIPHVTISCATANGRVRLSVRDNGIGVPPAQQSQIFTAFERLHGREGYPGSGLGLAIVARGAERMNGHCGVNSDGFNGSEFWIELPAARTETPDGSPDPAS